MKKIKCAVCGCENNNIVLISQDYRFQTTSKRFELVKCQRCGLIFIDPQLAKDEVAKFYPKNFYEEPSQIDKVITKISFYPRQRKILNYAKQGRILDLGCGKGEFLSNFKMKGWVPFGVDVSEVACELAREKVGKNIYNCQLKECFFPSDYFDVIVLSHVLEHLLNPIDDLVEIRRILKLNGILMLSVPDIGSLQFRVSSQSWIHLDIPRHLYHYSFSSIKFLLERSNFEIVRLTHPFFDFPLDFYKSLKQLNGSFRYIWLLATVYKIFPQFRGTMEIIAQKTNGA